MVSISALVRFSVPVSLLPPRAIARLVLNGTIMVRPELELMAPTSSMRSPDSLICPPVLLMVPPAMLMSRLLAGSGAGTPEPVMFSWLPELVPVITPLTTTPDAPTALDADTVPEILMALVVEMVPAIEAATMLVAVVDEDTEPVAVTPSDVLEITAPARMSSPVPDMFPTVALPVSATWPTASTRPPMVRPVPAVTEALFSVPDRLTFPPVLATVAPLASMPPWLLADALAPTSPVRLITPLPAMRAPVSRLKPRETCATPLGTPTLPCRVMEPLPEETVELLTTTPPA